MVMKELWELALAKAVEAIYFADNSDYETALWDIVGYLGGQDAVHLLDNDEYAAYKKYCESDEI